jgi:hypothetical protein
VCANKQHQQHQSSVVTSNFGVEGRARGKDILVGEQRGTAAGSILVRAGSVLRSGRRRRSHPACALSPLDPGSGARRAWASRDCCRRLRALSSRSMCANTRGRRWPSTRYRARPPPPTACACLQSLQRIRHSTRGSVVCIRACQIVSCAALKRELSWKVRDCRTRHAPHLGLRGSTAGCTGEPTAAPSSCAQEHPQTSASPVPDSTYTRAQTFQNSDERS